MQHGCITESLAGGAEIVTAEDFNLTDRDLDMLQGLADGVTTTEMAERLGITANGVRSAIKLIAGKLGTHSQVHSVAAAMRKGLIE